MKKSALTIWLTGLALSALAPFAPLAFAEFVVPTAPNGYVLDEANVLSDSTESQLETELADLQTFNSTQIVVVTLTDLQGYEPEQAALKIGRDWGVGQEGLDNGVVFLIAPTERVARIEVGYGLEGAITDAQSYQILNDLALPRFGEDNYDQGTLDAINALDTLARGEPFVMPETGSEDTPVWVSLFYLLPLGWGFLSWMSRSKAWWVGGIFGGIFGFLFAGGLLGFGLGLVGGLLLDYILSTYFYQKLGMNTGTNSWWYLGGGRGGSGGGFGGGGFGGFGGGSFGGGGASGRF